MFVKNFLTSGDFLTVVPLGCPLTLQYGVNGSLEKVLKGWGDDLKDSPDEVMAAFLKDELVPRKISVTNGTTFVSGVLYTNTRYKVSGQLPESIESKLLEDYINGRGTFNFFAGNVVSYATVFRGASPVRQWLTFSKFNVIPGYLIPHDIDESKFEKMVNNSTFPFTYPLISNYIVFHNGEVSYHTTGLKQNIVLSAQMYVDNSGLFKSRLTFVDGDTLDVNYSDITRFQILSGSVVILDELNNIIYAYDEFKGSVDKTVNCPFCSKLVNVPEEGIVMCDDPHCNSRLYPRTKRLLDAVHLPDMSYPRYLHYVETIGDAYSIVDVIDAPEYSDINIQTTLPELIFGIIPPGVGITLADATLLCNRTNHSVNTLMYYIHNPERMIHDLHFDGHVGFNKLVGWLADGANVLDVESVLHHPKISLSGSNRKFEGLPILRNKTMLITGNFLHGDLAEISSLLASYSGKVVTELSDAVDCVIIGDSHENINGHIVQSAKAQNIPIFTESEFFQRYQIDEDIAENL